MATVLLIDDDELLRRAVVRMRRSGGHVVVEAANGRDGVRAVRRGPPDLVITDIIMPEQEGIETIAQIRELSPLPIIAMSGTQRSAQFDPLGDAGLLGADVVITKPFTSEVLLAHVETLLRTSILADSSPTKDSS
jgi:CheY-like chemotaxis protein